MEVFDIQASVCSLGFVLQLETTEIGAKEWQSKSYALEKLVVHKMNSRRQGLVSMPEVFKTRISVWSREEDNWERNFKKTRAHRWTTDWVSWDEEKGRVNMIARK